MPYLIVAALIALGYWGYTRSRTGRPLLPGASTTRTPEAIVRADVPPTISNEVLDLLRNGRDPQSMHDVATEMEKYGFFDAAMLLHKRADELAILQQRVDAILVGRGLNPATASPTLREAILQGLMLVQPSPTAPSAPSPRTPTPEEAATAIRNAVGVLDTDYGNLDREIRSIIVTPQFLTGWNQLLVSWRSFALGVERSTPAALPAMAEDLRMFRELLINWRARFLVQKGAPVVEAPVPQAPPPGPGTQAANPLNIPAPQVAVPFRPPSLSDFGPSGRGGPRGRG